jgi:hypothetical protein
MANRPSAVRFLHLDDCQLSQDALTGITRHNFPSLRQISLDRCTWPDVTDMRAHLQEIGSTWIDMSKRQAQLLIQLEEEEGNAELCAAVNRGPQVEMRI